MRYPKGGNRKGGKNKPDLKGGKNTNEKRKLLRKKNESKLCTFSKGGGA